MCASKSPPTENDVHEKEDEEKKPSHRLSSIATQQTVQFRVQRQNRVEAQARKKCMTNERQRDNRTEHDKTPILMKCSSFLQYVYRSQPTTLTQARYSFEKPCTCIQIGIQKTLISSMVCWCVGVSTTTVIVCMLVCAAK